MQIYMYMYINIFFNSLIMGWTDGNSIGSVIVLPVEGFENHLNILCICHKFMRRLDELKFDLPMDRRLYSISLGLPFPRDANLTLVIFLLPSFTHSQLKSGLSALKALRQPLKFHLQLFAIICLNKYVAHNKEIRQHLYTLSKSF